MNKNPDKIVLLRGLAREAGHWGESLKTFQLFFPTSQIITPDLPGAGVNHKSKVPWGVNKFIPIIREQVDIKEGETNLIMGLSLGGMCAMEWVKQYPKDFKAAVIMNSSFGDISAPWKRMKIEQLAQMGLAQFRKKAESEALVMEIVSNNPTGYERNVKNACEIFEMRPMKFEAIARQLLAGALYQMKLKEAPIPVLALGSMKDQLVSSECSVGLGEKINCEVRLHPWAGHELAMDDPEWVCTQSRDWWNSLNFS